MTYFCQKPNSRHVKQTLNWGLTILLILILTVDFTSSHFTKNRRKQKPKTSTLVKTEENDTLSEESSSEPINGNSTLNSCPGSLGCLSNKTDATEEPKMKAEFGRALNGDLDSDLEQSSPEPIKPTEDSEGNQKTSVEEQVREAEQMDEEQLNQVFNSQGRLAWTTAYVNHSVVEAKCSKSNPCIASDLVLPLCGSDGESYLNTGVFQCAQKCNKELTVYEVGPCSNYVMPPEPDPTNVPSSTTSAPSHKTPNSRIKIRSFIIQPLLRLFGFHVHDDGGIYLKDEKKNHQWWNF